jgi:tight adherence protein B
MIARADLSADLGSLIPSASAVSVPFPLLVVALVAVFVAILTIASIALGTFKREVTEGEAILRRLSVYTLTGRQPVRVEPQQQQPTRGSRSAVTRSAVDLVSRMVKRRDLSDGIDVRLEAAGLPIRTAEWLLLHVGITAGTALVFMLLGGGRLAPTLVGLVLGFVAPWLLLSIRQSRRENAFLAQLPDTLQLLAGGLQAGYSLPQAMDSVVRESKPPISVEFSRALIETRLGMSPEEALDGIAGRTHSRDFSWIVMAIRIQREVGGNLAELLGTVAETLRERERVHREVRSLSAEGRLSAWILGLLPVVFTVYLVLAKGAYLAPLYQEPLGRLMILTALVLLAVGAEWMRRAIKVEV